MEVEKGGARLPVLPELPPGMAPRDPITLEYVSPSAIESFDERLGGCPRKWAFTKLDRLPRVMGTAAAIGDRTHKHHERYLREGVPYDQTNYEGRLAAATVHLLPPYNPAAYEVERDLRIKVAGYWFGGRVDLRWREVRDGVPVSVVLDHKTIGDLKWAKLTRASLLEHPQAPIYALATMQDHGTTTVDLRWNYVQKNSPHVVTTPKVAPSWHTISDVEAYAGVSPWLESAAWMTEIVALANKRGVRANDLPPNPNACDAYGGCPFRSHCTVTRKEYLDYNMTAQPNFKERLAQRLAAAGKGTVPAVSSDIVPAPAPVAPVTPVAPPLPPPPAPVAAAAPGPAPLPPPPPPVAVAQVPVQHYGPAINPPESALPVAAPPAAPAPEPAVEVAPAPVEAAPIEAPKRPRGRPRKNVDASATPPALTTPPAELGWQKGSDAGLCPSDEAYERLRGACIIAAGTITVFPNNPDLAASVALATYQAITEQATGA